MKSHRRKNKWSKAVEETAFSRLLLAGSVIGGMTLWAYAMVLLAGIDFPAL